MILVLNIISSQSRLNSFNDGLNHSKSKTPTIMKEIPFSAWKSARFSPGFKAYQSPSMHVALNICIIRMQTEF